MKPGDLVIRRIDPQASELILAAAVRQRNELGHGMVLSKHYAGTPAHWCVSVWYPKVGKVYDIAESLMEVISESR
tara:strand:+ start:939 stop:1163 length:225 start_codon:yes stop_codon:yes gene_type:complete